MSKENEIVLPCIACREAGFRCNGGRGPKEMLWTTVMRVREEAGWPASVGCRVKYVLLREKSGCVCVVVKESCSCASLKVELED